MPLPAPPRRALFEVTGDRRANRMIGGDGGLIARGSSGRSIRLREDPFDRDLASTFGCTFPHPVPPDLCRRLGHSHLPSSTETFDVEWARVRHYLLSDEITRAAAKLQSALLEVRPRPRFIASSTQRVPPPCLLLATQNPIERGRYPLPEARATAL